MNDRKQRFHDALDDLLDRPIAYNPAFKRITKSTVASIFLSQAWFWSKRHREDNGWFFETQVQWEEETGLSRYEQETARRHCRELGVMEEKLKGVPATLYYRVNKQKVYELLGLQFAETPQTEIAETPQTSPGELPKIAEKQQSGNAPNINKESETSPMTSTSTGGAGGKNIFQLYEDCIGPLTPIMSDKLKDAEKEYPSLWIAEAFEECVTHNIRKWAYVHAVLKRWKDQARGDKPKSNGNGSRPALPKVEVEDRPMVTQAMLDGARGVLRK